MTANTAAPTVTPDQQRKVAPALTRYRVLAWTTGIWLLALTSELIVRYGFDVDRFRWVEVVHGWVYFVYLLVTIDMAVKIRWPWPRTIGTLVAGTIPFLSFYAEHRNASDVKRQYDL
jgi:integral membrane protein